MEPEQARRILLHAIALHLLGPEDLGGQQKTDPVALLERLEETGSLSSKVLQALDRLVTDGETDPTLPSLSTRRLRLYARLARTRSSRREAVRPCRRSFPASSNSPSTIRFPPRLRIA